MPMWCQHQAHRMDVHQHRKSSTRMAQQPPLQKPTHQGDSERPITADPHSKAANKPSTPTYKPSYAPTDTKTTSPKPSSTHQKTKNTGDRLEVAQPTKTGTNKNAPTAPASPPIHTRTHRTNRKPRRHKRIRKSALLPHTTGTRQKRQPRNRHHIRRRTSACFVGGRGPTNRN